MEAKEEIRLSSKWTKFNIYFPLIVCIISEYIFFFMFMKNKFEIGMVFIGIASLIIIMFLIYQFIYTSEAWVIKDKLVLKKQFKPSKSYAFEKIGNLRSFKMKRIKYIIINVENNDKELEKYWIMTQDDLLGSEKSDTEQILISLRDTAKEDQLNNHE